MNGWDRELETTRETVAALDSLRGLIEERVWLYSVRGLPPELVECARIVSDTLERWRLMLEMMQEDDRQHGELLQQCYAEGGQT